MTMNATPSSSPGTTPPRKQIADRGVRHQRVDDHRNRRRNDRPDDGRRRTDRAGVRYRVSSVAGHHGDDDAADADRVGDRRSRHAGEDDVRDDADVAEPTTEPSDEYETEVQQAVGKAPGVHQIGGEDEQGDRKQDVTAVEAVQQLLGCRAGIEAGEAAGRRRRHRSSTGRSADPNVARMTRTMMHSVKALGIMSRHSCSGDSCPGRPAAPVMPIHASRACFTMQATAKIR